MRRLLVPILCCAVVVLGLSGCRGSTSVDPPGVGESGVPPIDFLPGERVGEMAEQRLEAEHLEMAVGSMTCPDLDWELNASVRCVKISELSDGRRVTILGTVTVTSVEGWGKLHVALDDRPRDFGIAAERLNADVATWVANQGSAADAVSCPYLPGVIKTQVRCPVTVSATEYGVLVTVTDVEDQDYRTVYSLRWETASPPA